MRGLGGLLVAIACALALAACDAPIVGGDEGEGEPPASGATTTTGGAGSEEVTPQSTPSGSETTPSPSSPPADDISGNFPAYLDCVAANAGDPMAIEQCTEGYSGAETATPPQP